MLENIQDFDEKFRHHRPQHDKSMMKRAMCISTLRVSWNLIEAEICHNPGTAQCYRMVNLRHKRIHIDL